MVRCRASLPGWSPRRSSQCRPAWATAPASAGSRRCSRCSIAARPASPLSTSTMVSALLTWRQRFWTEDRNMIDELSSQLQRLRDTIRGYGSVVVAYSGGVDSSVVLKLACEQLGQRALGCIADSPALAKPELQQALAVAAGVALPVRVVR